MKRFYTLFVLMFLIAFVQNIKAQKWAVKFDGNDPNSYIDCGFSDNLYPDSITIEAWIYQDRWVPNGNYVLATENWTEETGPRGYAIRLMPETGVEFVLGLGANEWGVVSSGYGTYDSCRWTHIASTFDGITMKIYLNGQLMMDQDVAGPMVPADQNLIIGEGATWKDRRFEGKMYDVRIWNKVRTQEEIQGAMNTLLNGDEPGLVANWKMDEGTGTTLHDATGNFPAPMNSGLSWFDRENVGPNPNLPEWMLQFDATDENSFVDCGYSESLYPDSMTIEGWIYQDVWVPNGNYVLATENWTEETGPRGYAIRLMPETGVEFVLGLGVNEWGVVASGYGTYDTLQWTHFAATFDGTTMKLYLNGEFMMDQDVAGPMVPADQSLIIGEGATWKNRRFTGKMYDVRLWKIARTQEEIQQTMDTRLNGDEPGLVAAWNMDEGTGTTLNDLTNTNPASMGSGVKWLSTSEPTGIDNLNGKDRIQLYPNPTANYLNMENIHTSSTLVSIFDINGKRIRETKLMPNERVSLFVGDFAKGIYVVRFENGRSVQTEKITVK